MYVALAMRVLALRNLGSLLRGSGVGKVDEGGVARGEGGDVGGGEGWCLRRV